MSSETFTDVSVDAVDRLGNRTRIDGLCAAELPSLDQLSVRPSGRLEPDELTTLEVRWREPRGSEASYTVAVRNDGLRTEHRAVDAV